MGSNPTLSANMKITIRLANDKDLENFHQLFSDTVKSEFPEYSASVSNWMVTKHWNKEKYEKLLANGTKLILIAETEGELVGILDAEYPFLGVSYCSWLMVKGTHQRKGIGTKLIREWGKISKEKSAHYMYLYTDSTRNNPYYESLGFKQQGKMEKAWFGQDHYIYGKQLQEPKEENYLKKLSGLKSSRPTCSALRQAQYVEYSRLVKN